jgi:N-ethylmaleimide reductase
MNIPDLFTPVRMGAIEAPDRIIMAPLTRMRAGPGRVPTPLMEEYYSQRAAAGLAVSEATGVGKYLQDLRGKFSRRGSSASRSGSSPVDCQRNAGGRADDGQISRGAESSSDDREGSCRGVA